MAIISSAIAAIVTAIGATGFIATATTAILQAAVGIGFSLLARAIFAPPKPETPSFGVSGKVQTGESTPRSFLVGRAATAGSVVYAGVWGQSAAVPNPNLVQVFALSDLPVQSLEEIWINGKKCTIDYSDPDVDKNRGYPITEFDQESGEHNCWIRFYDGTQTTADAYLVANFAGDPDRPYGTDRIGYGVAYAILTARSRRQIFSGIPTVKFVCIGTKLYDPSKDTTVGGAGTQRWANPSTWGGDGDHLPAVQAYNVLRGFTYGGKWLYGPQNMPAARLPAANWIEAINACRATTPVPDGSGGATTEPLYRAAGEVKVDVEVADGLTEILTTCQGRLAEIGGIYKLHVGEPAAPTGALNDGAILSTSEGRHKMFAGLEATANGVTAKYPNPVEGYATKDAPPIYVPEFEAQDGGRRLMADLTLNMAPYGYQVQRLMQAALKEGRRTAGRRHTLALPPEYWEYEPNDVLTFDSDNQGYVAKLFRIDGMQDLDTGDMMVDLTEVDPGDYSFPITIYTPVSNSSTVVTLPPIPSLAVTSLSATASIKGVDLEWPQVVSDDLDFYEVYESASIATPSEFAAASYPVGRGTKYRRGNLAPGSELNFWVRAADTSGNRGPWSPRASATPENVNLEAEIDQADLAPGLFLPGFGPVLPPTPFDASTPKTFLRTTDKLLYQQDANGTGWIAVADATLIVGQIVAGQISVVALSSIVADLGVITAGVIKNAANTFRIEADNGRILIGS